MADDTTSVIAAGETALKSGRAGWRTDPSGKTTWTTQTEGVREATQEEIAGKMGPAAAMGPGTQAGGAIWGYPPQTRLPGYTQAPSDADVVKLPSGAYQVSWEGREDYDPRRGIGGPGGAILWYDPRKPRSTVLPSGTNLEQAIGRRIEEETRQETLTPEMARAAGRDPFDFAWGSRKQKLAIAKRWGLDTTARRYLYGVAGTPEGGIDTGVLVEGYGKKGAVRELQVLGIPKGEAQSRVRVQEHITDGQIDIVGALEAGVSATQLARDLAVVMGPPEPPSEDTAGGLTAAELVSRAQTHISDTAKFKAKNVEVAPDVWYPRADWDKLTTRQRDEVLDTGSYATYPEGWWDLKPWQRREAQQKGWYTPIEERKPPVTEPLTAWGAEVGDRPTTGAVAPLGVPTRVPTGAWPRGLRAQADIGAKLPEQRDWVERYYEQRFDPMRPLYAGAETVVEPPLHWRPPGVTVGSGWGGIFEGFKKTPHIWGPLALMAAAPVIPGAGVPAVLGRVPLVSRIAPLAARVAQFPGVRQTLAVGQRFQQVPGVRQVIAPVTTIGGRTVPSIAQVALRTGKVIGATGGAAMLTTGVGAVGVGALTAPPRVDPTQWTKLDEATIEVEVAPYKKATGFVSIADGTETTYSIDVRGMIDDYGWERTTRLLASMEDLEEKPSLERGVWEKLDTGSQALYEPTVRRDPIYEKGLFGAWGRGTERAYTPVTEWLEGKGLPGQLGSGMFSYFAPHQMASELYKTKGPVAFAVLAPHLGPTAIRTGLTWKEQSLLGKVSGIGFAALPFAVGPAGAAATRVGTFVGKVPVVGPISRVAYKPIGAVTGTVRGVERFGKEQLGIPTMGEWAPWRMASTVSGLGGKLGLARVPKLGPAGVRWGWWKRPPSGLDPFKGKEFAEFPEALKIRIDIEKAMAGPTRPAQPALRQLTGMQRDILGAGGRMEYSARGTWEVVPPEGHVAFRGSRGETLVKPVKTMTPAELEIYRVQTYGPSRPWTPGEVRWPARVAEVRFAEAPSQYLSELFRGWRTPVAGVVRAAPRVAMVAPVLGVAAASVFAPTIAVAVDIPQLVKQDIAALDQMLREDVITAVEHSTAVEEISRIEARDVTVQEYLDQVDVVVSDTLAPEQVEAYQAVRERQVDLEKVRVTDQQQLGQMEQVQQEQMRQFQEQFMQQYQVQQVLWDEQTQMRQQVEEEQAKFRAQIGLPLVPFLPFMAGPKMGFGWAGRRMFGVGGSGAVGAWEAPGMVISAPHPLESEVVTRRFGKFRRKYGAVAPRQQVAGLKGIRAS